MQKDDLRPHVFYALRSQPRSQFGSVEDFVRSRTSSYQHQDGFKIREILWELLVQGILAPGMDASNLDFPWIHVTEYGSRCLEAGEMLPHDPTGYIARLQQRVGQPLDDVVLMYIREGLLTFLAGHYLSATVMLGVASEQCIDLLIEALTNAIGDTGRKAAFESNIKKAGRSIKRRFDTLRAELLLLNLPSELKDSLDIQLSATFTLIRYSRNDTGHPTGRTIDRDEAHANLLLIPQYFKRIYDLMDYFQTNTV
jgi:hypothetical protein